MYILMILKLIIDYSTDLQPSIHYSNYDTVTGDLQYQHSNNTFLILYLALWF